MAQASGKPNKRVSLVVAAIVVVVSMGAWLAVQFLGSTSVSGSAIVKDADGKSYELPLSSDAEITVTSSAGTNVVQVSGGKVRVREADCPNQDCVHQGFISTAGQQIVCLPHKLTVDVSASGAKPAYDVVGS